MGIETNGCSGMRYGEVDQVKLLGDIEGLLLGSECLTHQTNVLSLFKVLCHSLPQGVPSNLPLVGENSFMLRMKALVSGVKEQLDNLDINNV